MSRKKLNMELHCHTVFSSDGLMDFADLREAARRVGLDVLAVTDHNTIEGAKEFRDWLGARDPGLQVIVGEERTLADGSHLIGLFLEAPIVADAPAEAIAEIEGQGGLCLIPHPFRSKDGLLRGGLEPLRWFEGHCAGFELFNAKCSAEVNRQARTLLSSGLGPFVGSDAHYDSDLGESLTVMTWRGDLKGSLRALLGRQAPFQLLGKEQGEAAPERLYAPLYYRYRKVLRVPKRWLPWAKSCYRRYRNWRYGVGSKRLIEVYAHS